jgi:hypothetical protein
MPRKTVSVPRTPKPWDLDIVSHGRRGPGHATRLTPGQVEQVARTVRKTPEVIVKVSGGARDAGGAKAHFDYIDRHGKLGLETDDGRELQGKGAGADLVADWNLDLSRGQYRPKPSQGEKDTRPKVVHNIVLSMPGRTPPEAVLAAARKFAREHFALQYRYAMALHTDQGHPHVHLVVKAEHEYEPGRRLHIRKAMLRHWREDFAACLREQGVAANATPAHQRGRIPTTKKDPIHQRLKDLRAYDGLSPQAKAQRQPPKESTFMRTKVEAVARALKEGRFAPGPGKTQLMDTRRAVTSEWLATASALYAQGETHLASEVETFIKAMPAVRTEQEQIAAGLLAQIEGQRQRDKGRAADDTSRRRGE